MGEYKSFVETVLKGAPEVIGFFPGRGNIAVNVYTLGKETYRVAIGERVDTQFHMVAESSSVQVEANTDLSKIAESEIGPFGERAKTFDIFVEGKLVRTAH